MPVLSLGLIFGGAMIRKTLCSVAFAALSIFSGELAAQSDRDFTYHYAPSKSKLHGFMHAENVKLDDPKMTFTAYILVLDKAISVPESGSYESVSGETRIQLQFQHHLAAPSSGTCIDVAGDLFGAETASDVLPLTMQVDSYSTCK
ncbi:hypothetical protein [Dyella mobilis]|uniref:Uncharacterized protein n=1 Tax=Dyella mobilis TaxID=1849582 RepID=A0ABS2KHK4_9GAMM|nr:hypothetical protein [Dyella mobilis]MBM7130644.1 hypothetical protein [Dyella mobilis]GLQ97271.1 hypothetical protein GCM10007863_16910 [Dyella mobilis]